MKFLKGKTILIVSPQDWGKMFLSKHHYALELARAGNTVFFLNPPDTNNQLPYSSVSIENNGLHPNLFLINHRLYFPYIIKFRSLFVFQLLMGPHLRKILKKIGKPVDLVWSFDIGNLYPFKWFPSKSLKIFHPVDEPLRAEAIDAATGANIIFSVTREILNKYSKNKVRKEFINHGVSADFLSVLDKNISDQSNVRIRVGYAGNLLRPDMDRSTIIEIVKQNPQVDFHFYGSYEIKQTNIGGSEDQETVAFINLLKQFGHVILHGVLDQISLAKAFDKMDAFLVSYDIEKDQSKGTNYHKLMEYIATGKTVISNNITTYADQPNLVTMVESRNSNRELPALFRKVINSINEYNSIQLITERREFAWNNTYSKQLERIDLILSEEFKF